MSKELLFHSKVVITGGLGFIGSNLVKKLIDEYHCEVVVIDNNTNSNLDYLTKYKSKFTFINTDALLIGNYSSFLEKAEYIFHLACTPISISSEYPELDLQVNALSILKILEFIKQNSLHNLKRILFASTSSIYGNLSELGISFTENDYPKLLTNYSATKYLGEHYTLFYCTHYKIPVTILRFSNVYGYGQTIDKPHCGVIGKFIGSIKRNEPLIIYGDGNQTRDFTFIDDTIEAILLAVTNLHAKNEVFNVGTGNEYSICQIISILKKIEPNFKIEYAPKRDVDNILHRSVNNNKSKIILGWKPMIGIEEGLERTYSSYMKESL